MRVDGAQRSSQLGDGHGGIDDKAGSAVHRQDVGIDRDQPLFDLPPGRSGQSEHRIGIVGAPRLVDEAQRQNPRIHRKAADLVHDLRHQVGKAPVTDALAFAHGRNDDNASEAKGPGDEQAAGDDRRRADHGRRDDEDADASAASQGSLPFRLPGSFRLPHTIVSTRKKRVGAIAWSLCFVLTLFVGLLIPRTAYSRGTDEESWEDVEGTDNWRHEIDIADREAGTYNVIVRGRDFAGNEYIEGPFNIRIDPESDLPVSRVVFPENGQVVRGNINVVGIAEDDDSLDRVQVRIDEGPWMEAEGGDYWRLFVPVENVEDGTRTVSTRAFDVNGLEGPESSSSFVLDTQPPRMEITSHAGGAIVSGRVRFDGAAYDANGIESVRLSRDGGESFEDLWVRHDQANDRYLFDFTVHTPDLDDGPSIYLLRAEDGSGSTIERPYLFFVDNVGPTISIIGPAEDETLFGTLRIVGAIRDAVGIQSFSYRFENEETEIPLEAGNPYWAVDLDSSEIGPNRTSVEFIAVDTSGNRTSLRRNLSLDQSVALPRVVIDTPDDEASVGPGDNIYGSVESVDEAEAVLVRGLTDELQEFRAYPAFEIPLADAPVGRLDLEIYARDVRGREGPVTRMRLVRRAPPARIEVQQLAYREEEPRSFLPGMDYDPLRQASLTGVIRTQARVASAAAELDGEAVRISTGRGAQEGETSFSIELPRDRDFGVASLQIEVVDEFETASALSTFVYYRDLRRIEADPGFLVEDERLTADGTLRLNQGRPFALRMIGIHGSDADGFRNLRLEPAPTFLSIRSDGTNALLEPRGEGEATVRILAETEEGVAIETGPYRVVVDRTQPVLTLESPGGPDLSGAALRLSGTIAEGSGIAFLEYSTDGGATFQQASVTGSAPSFRFSTSVDLGDNPPQGIGLVLRVGDLHGNTAVLRRALNLAESQAAVSPGDEDRRNDRPTLQLLVPGPRALPTRDVVLAGVVRDLDGTEFVEVAVDDGDFRRLATFPSRVHHQTFTIELPGLSVGDHDIRLRATDRLGEQSAEVRTRLTVGGPTMEISLSRVGDRAVSGPFRALLSARTLVEGLVTNGTRLQTLRYRVDEGDWTGIRHEAADRPDEARSFRFELSDRLGYGSHVIEIEAVDREGNSSRLRSLFFVRAEGSAGPLPGELVFVDSRSESGGLRLESADALVGRYLGRPPAEVEARGAEGLVDLRVEGNAVVLRGLSAGTADLRFVVTTVDGVVTEGPIRRLFVDLEDPTIEPVSELRGLYTADRLVSRGRAEDDSGDPEVTLRLGTDGPFSRVSLDGESLDLSGTTEGPVHLFYRATDAAGKETTAWVPIVYDPREPEIGFVSPADGDIINGRTGVFGFVTSASPISRVEYSTDGENFEVLGQNLGPRTSFSVTVDFSALDEAGAALVVRATDRAGNQAQAGPVVDVDAEADRPVAQIQIPAADAVVTTDFTISGMAFDDDGIAAIYRRIDDGDYVRMPGANNFSAVIPLSEVSDNEHVIEVYAEDVYGLAGPVVSRRFRVSLNQPEVELVSPLVEETNRGVITLRGFAADENGVDVVDLSLDNGNSRLRTAGDVEWSYDLDTRVFTDGTYSLQTIAVDSYGIEGRYFTLVNIDNTAPELTIDVPTDGDRIAGSLQVNGRMDDGVGVESLVLVLESIAQGGEVLRAELTRAPVVQESVDISSLPEGWYNVRVVATDAAANETMVARNIYVQDDVESSFALVHFPQVGEDRAGPIFVEGRVGAASAVQRAQVLVNGVIHGSVEPNSRGYFRYALSRDDLRPGDNTVQAMIEPAQGERVLSTEHGFRYRPTGGYVSIDSHQIGDFVSDRPWIEGTAGYRHELDESERVAIDGTRVARVLVSLDNGRTFAEASGRETWRYRIETGGLADGPLAVLVRSEYRNGESAVSRTILTVDKSAPEVALRSPTEGASLNETLPLIGTSFDDYGVSQIQVALRPGDKAGYAVPSFIQGMYLDVHTLGITYFQVGLGLTFFDQNVKLQAQFGVSPETTAAGGTARFAGYTIGGKILANVASIPFNALFGPDWEFLSLNVALGATFNYISLYEPITPFGTDPITGVVLSAIIGQIEFPRFTFSGLTAFNAISLYFEPQVWFIPSDVSPDVAVRLTFGARVQLF